MATTPIRLAQALLALFSLNSALAGGPGAEDPTGRVARLDHRQGELAYSPAGENEWIELERNRPIARGDRLWTDRAARLELQFGNAAIRLGPETSFEFLHVGDRAAQLKMSQGVMQLRVRPLPQEQRYEIATPRLAFLIRQPGSYRVEYDPRDDRSSVVVWEGAGEVRGRGFRFPLGAGESVRFYDGDLRRHEMVALPRDDTFDRYCRDRDTRLDRSGSLRYVNDTVTGYPDLDDYGSWRSFGAHGAAWMPHHAGPNWTPFRDGHWVWQEPWGWSWIDAAPWGFATSHFGRWLQTDGRWVWIPGPRNQTAVYAPAMVAFVGGSQWSLLRSFGAVRPIGWFPLGPNDAYLPTEHSGGNHSGRTIASDPRVQRSPGPDGDNAQRLAASAFENGGIVGAITAVPSEVLINSRSVQAAAIQLDHRARTSAWIVRETAVAAVSRSALGAGHATRVQPPREALERAVVVCTAPPSVRASGRSARAGSLLLLDAKAASINLREAGSTLHGAGPSPRQPMLEQTAPAIPTPGMQAAVGTRPPS